MKHYLSSLLLMLLTSVAMADQSLTGEDEQRAVATFAGGCFWCMEKPFDQLDGVLATISGYSGGEQANPTYKTVSSGTSGHYEVIRIEYDPDRISYEKLLEVFWRNVDPTNAKGQFCDIGPQYRTAIFVHDEAQRALAQQSLDNLKANKPFSEPVSTPILPAAVFYAAEEYHQDYYKKNPLRYRYYRYSCGRDQRLEAVWGAPEQPDNG